jgi:hypothetical protein
MLSSENNTLPTGRFSVDLHRPSMTDSARRYRGVGPFVRIDIRLPAINLLIVFFRDKQHRAIKLGMGGLYPAPEVVRAILAPQEGVTKRIVDLGKRSPASWQTLADYG